MAGSKTARICAGYGMEARKVYAVTVGDGYVDGGGGILVDGGGDLQACKVVRRRR